MEWTYQLICEAEHIHAELLESGCSVSLEPMVYASLDVTSRKYPCVGGFVYRVQLPLENRGAKVNCVISWYQDEKLCFRKYIQDGEEVVSPKGANYFSVSYLISARTSSEVRIGDMAYTPIKAYAPNIVTMASISLDDIDEEQAKSLNPEKLLKKYVSLIDEVEVKQSTDLILLTEHFHNIGLPLSMEERSITMDDVVIQTLKEKARQYHTYIAGSIHRKEDGHYYNTAILIDRQGNLVGTYDKTHLTYMEFQMGIIPGCDIPVFDTDFGKVGFLICWDAWFPILSQILYRKGVKLILNPTLGGGFCQAYADSFATGSFMLVCNGNKNWSRVQNPLGETIAQGDGKNYVIATVDLDEPYMTSGLSVATYGEGRNLYLREARDDLYKDFFTNWKE